MENENEWMAKVMLEARHEINCRTDDAHSTLLVQFIRLFVYWIRRRSIFQK